MDSQTLETQVAWAYGGEDLKIVLWPDEVLDTPCAPVETFGPELRLLGDKMLDYIRNNSGVGLAANQVGFGIRMFVMLHYMLDVKGNYAEDTSIEPIIAVNPVVKGFGDKEPYQEGCLSVPSIFEQVIRPHSAIMEYQDPTGAKKTVELHGLNARIAMHEQDHLDGIMFFNYKGENKRMSKQVGKRVEERWLKVRPQYVERQRGK